MLLESGRMLGRRYEILGQIGTGGMSDVYRAKDHSLDREVAIKVLKEELATDTSFVTKFKAEAQAAAGLEHPNIVNIYDVGSEGNLYYIVMEIIEGITLKTYIAKKSSLSYNEVISIAIQVGRGIEAAHNKGIVHRDIKPQNIMISKEGKVKVTDFGIARIATEHTMSQDPMGSVHYTSPEQARGGFSNFQSDIYSLGIVMYEMCTGRVPFDGDTAVSVAIQHLQSEMPSPTVYAPNLPISVEKIIKKCTMKSPDRRYANIEELLVDLKKALVSPDEDFVNIGAAPGSEGTRVMTQDDLAALRTNNPETPTENPGDEYDEEDEENSTVNPKLDKAINIMGIAAAIVIIAIFIFIIGSVLGWFKFGGTKAKDEETAETTEEVEVPDVLGMSEAEAKRTIEAAGLVYKNAGTISSDDFEEGKVCEQSRNGGTKVASGTTIKVKISTGKGEISVPNVVGQSESTAEQMLKDKGFEVVKEYKYSSDVAQGVVMTQSPEANAQGKEGDTVTITISQGEESIAVPSVTGQSQEAAKSTLESAGFTVSISEEYSDTVEKGKVISQNPGGGNYASKGDEVSLVVSKGPKTVYYSFSMSVEPVDDIETTYTLLDAEGNQLAEWSVISTKTISKSKITTSTGTLLWDNGDNSGSQAVTFTRQ